jgi:hypothetical protein
MQNIGAWDFLLDMPQAFFLILAGVNGSNATLLCSVGGEK